MFIDLNPKNIDEAFVSSFFVSSFVVSSSFHYESWNRRILDLISPNYGVNQAYLYCDL